MNGLDFLEQLLKVSPELFIVVPRTKKESLASYQICNVVYLDKTKSQLVLSDDAEKWPPRPITEACLTARDIVGLIWSLKDFSSFEDLKVSIPSKDYFTNISPLCSVTVGLYYSNPYSPFSSAAFETVYLNPES